MKTRLLQFRVTNFRSVSDSGLIQAQNCNCLIGTNESGKTNLLAALWKLNPANNEPIRPLLDYPRKNFTEYDESDRQECFVHATFAFDAASSAALATEFRCDAALLERVEVARQYDGQYRISFPDTRRSTYPRAALMHCLDEALCQLAQHEALTREKKETRDEWIATLNGLRTNLPPADDLSLNECLDLLQQVEERLIQKVARKSAVRACLDNALKTPLEHLCRLLSCGGLTLTDEQKARVLAELPKFIYCSEYEVLDTEIYLPHVIQHTERTDLGEKERAKMRSLRVLFEFVRIRPDDILNLGRESGLTKVVTKDTYGRVERTGYEDQDRTVVDQERLNKRRREVLLQSASTRLTHAFRGWWRQSQYRFRFQADGNHFRIWVSDDKRPEEIELESRSRGLQWFFSFFLLFMVERKTAHDNCVLLLDEPGNSLHPIAQRDLLTFLTSLSADNQLIYTTHSPFLIDVRNPAATQALYVDAAGNSTVLDEITLSDQATHDSLYPITAALSLCCLQEQNAVNELERFTVAF